jgi:hypothetical protein
LTQSIWKAGTEPRAGARLRELATSASKTRCLEYSRRAHSGAVRARGGDYSDARPSEIFWTGRVSIWTSSETLRHRVAFGRDAVPLPRGRLLHDVATTTPGGSRRKMTQSSVQARLVDDHSRAQHGDLAYSSAHRLPRPSCSSRRGLATVTLQSLGAARPPRFGPAPSRGGRRPGLSRLRRFRTSPQGRTTCRP